MLIQGKLLTNVDDLSEVLLIKQKVFVEELGYRINDLSNEEQLSMYVIVYEEDPSWKENQISKKAVATGRLYFDGENCEIADVAVLSDYRNKKYGDFAVRMLLNKAFTSGINTVRLTTPIQTIDFFKSIGFQKLHHDSSNVDVCRMIIQIKDIITKCSR